ncbi:MAG TPA: S49 family peptidase [Candidatus Competibacteraceae bacterium]|nr:S49 family peptidase [Candidatus Competibacteraceae bacterium]
MNCYPYLASRLFNTPLLIHPGKLHAIIAGLSERFSVVAPAAPQAYTTPQGTREKGGYRLLDNGVAVLDVFGILAHRGGLQADSSYIQGYDELARNLEGALNDPNVGAILLNIDSPGGEVAGAFQLADQIYAARARKPIAAIAGDMAASAAYLIASAADSVSVALTGLVGSIGVVTSHVDMSRAVDRMGMTVTYIYAGAHKVDGNPLEPLPEAVAATIQAEVDYYYGLFLETAARNRQTQPAALQATEARIYIGQKALEARLADRIETPDQAIARLAAQISGKRVTGKTMKLTDIFSRKRLNLDISVSEADPDEAPDQGELPAEPELAPAPPADPPAPEPETLSALAIVQGCQAAGMPRLAEHILKTPHTADQFQARITSAKAVRAVCETARVPELADGLIASGATENDAKVATWAALVARSAQNAVDATPPDKQQILRRAEFSALSPFQQREFIHAGGKITE